MIKKMSRGLSLILCMIGLTGCMEKTNKQIEWKTIEQERVSIHDPSILSVKDSQGRPLYYLFGTHLAQAKSKDLLTWQVPFSSEYETMEDNLIFGKTDVTLKKTFEWAGYNDADSEGGYNIWAPDIFWNEEYEWKDGSKGAYMYYYSATSTWRRSAIGFVVSKELEGQYETGETIVYSGFTEVDSTDGSERNTHYQGTNLKKLIQSGKVQGFSSEWVTENGQTYNTDYAPNAIDPAFFSDETGKLWMTYGSWSGGIFLLEINPQTGLPVYPGVDGKTTDGRTIDRYFGVKLAGGYHQSIEGPYIVYDKEAGYYYLFVTYGGLQADGGYNMRLFRSEKATGPYLDAKEQMPIFSRGDKNDDFGVKLMGNYQFKEMAKAYKSGGHNSALMTEDGKRYLIYHTRFSGGEDHQVRIHPMVMTESGWPIATPYEYSGQPLAKERPSNKELIGEFELIKHGTDSSAKVVKSSLIYFEEDGKITGEIIGNWQIQATGELKVIIDSVSYSGVLVKELDESTPANEVLAFSLLGDNNEVIWGSRIINKDD